MRRAASPLISLLGGLVLVVGAVCLLAALGRAIGSGLDAGRSVAMLVGAAAIGLAVRLWPARRLLGGYSALVYVFLFAPIVVVVVYAFNAGQTVALFEGVSTRWFSAGLSNEAAMASVGRSLRIALTTALVTAVLGTGAAVALTRMRTSMRVGLESVVFFALVVPELMIAVGLTLFFNRAGVPLGTGAMMLGHVTFGTALVTMVVRARYATMSDELERASADLGAGPWSTARQVTIPQLLPAIVAGALLAFTFSFDDVIISQFNSGSGNQTWPLNILSSLRFGIEPDTNAIAAMMLAVTLIALAAAGLLLRLSSRQTRSSFTAAP